MSLLQRGEYNIQEHFLESSSTGLNEFSGFRTPDHRVKGQLLSHYAGACVYNQASSEQLKLKITWDLHI